jgi:hypothetical protein
MVHEKGIRALGQAFTFWALLSWSTWGQTPTATIAGKVVDEQNQAIPGAEVTVTGQDLKGPRAAVTNLDGEFRIPDIPLTATSLKVKAEASGYATVVRKFSLTDPNETKPLILALAGSTECMMIDYPAMIGYSNPVRPEPLLGWEIAPLPPRVDHPDTSYGSLLEFTHGATYSGAAGSPAVEGSTGTENIYELAGLITNDPVTGALGTNLPSFLFHGAESQAVGIGADQPGSTGALFQAYLPSGSNEFHAQALAWVSPSGLTARRTPTFAEVSREGSASASELGFLVSGPFVKDRFWYAVGLDRTQAHDESRGTDGLFNWRKDKYRFFAFRREQTRESTSFFAKFAWRATDRQNLHFSVFGDPTSEETAGIDGPSYYFGQPSLFPGQPASHRSTGGWGTSLQWFWTVTPKFFFNVTLGKTHRRDDLLPAVGGAVGYGTIGWFRSNWAPGPLNTSGGLGDIHRDDRDTLQGSIRFVGLLNRKNRHEFDFGAEVQKSNWESYTDFTGGWKFTAWKRAVLVPPIEERIQNPFFREQGAFAAIYLQDKIGLTDYMTLIPGLRWERNRLDSQRGNALTLTSLSPRLGLIWDYARNGKSKLFFSCGRYFQRVPLGLARYLEADHCTIRSYSGDWPWSIHIGGLPARPLPGLKVPSQDEAVLGISYEIAPDLLLTARGVYRNLRRTLELVQYEGPGHGKINYLIMNPGFQDSPLLDPWKGDAGYAPFPKPKRRYRALEVLAEKRFSNRWFGQGSYILSRLEGNTPGGASIGPSEWSIPTASLHTDGPLPTDRRHQVKLFGGYRFDGGFLLSGLLRFETGNPAFEPYLVGHDVRFSLYRNPSLLLVNFHAEYTWKIRRRDLTVFADVVNLANTQTATSASAYYRVSQPEARSFGDPPSRQGPRAVAFGLRWAM